MPSKSFQRLTLTTTQLTPSSLSFLRYLAKLWQTRPPEGTMLCVYKRYSRMVKLNGVEKYIVKKGGSRNKWWGYVCRWWACCTGGGGSDENSGGSSTSQTNSKDGVGAFGGASFSVVSAAVLYGCSTHDTVFQLRNRRRRNNYRLFSPSGTQSFAYTPRV